MDSTKTNADGSRTVTTNNLDGTATVKKYSANGNLTSTETINISFDATAHERQVNRDEVEKQANLAMTRLAQIRDANSPTNAQVIQAVKDMAVIQRRVIRLLLNQFDGSD